MRQPRVVLNLRLQRPDALSAVSEQLVSSAAAAAPAPALSSTAFDSVASQGAFSPLAGESAARAEKEEEAKPRLSSALKDVTVELDATQLDVLLEQCDQIAKVGGGATVCLLPCSA